MKFFNSITGRIDSERLVDEYEHDRILKPKYPVKVVAYVAVGLICILIIICIMMRFQERSPPVEHYPLFSKYPTIFDAVNNGDQHDVEAFIKSGIDLNTKDAMGQTAFHLAVKKGYEDIVKMLMKNAAFQNIEDDNGDSPLSLAIETGRENIAMLILNDPKFNNLHWDRIVLGCVARNASKKLIDALAERDVFTNLDNRVTVEQSISKDDFRRVKNLLNKCNITKELHPLNGACQACSIKTLKMLIDRGEDVNAADGIGWRPIHVAAFNGCEEAVRILLKNGADILGQIKIGGTACQLAEREGLSKITKLMKC